MANNDKKFGDWAFIVPIVLAAVILGILRRAYTISLQFGYPFWSYETWAELKIQLLAAVLFAAACVALAFIRSNRN